MDQQKLRSLVFEKTGVKIDSDDPIFALVALNEAVLAETVERQIALLDAATRELAAQARAAGSLTPLPPLPQAAAPAEAPAAFTPRDKRLLAAAAVICVLSAALALAGQALLFKPAATPVQYDAAKLARAIAKIDPKSRALLQAELQKP
ncbi:hypothetical protein [Janthinobacterium agaricidamnosum]|uniref:Transmembrane protein n=1 Tax=Janthinobacterium agaricidamnosum NBRC 102515 = DSM 9628 TaxID=1349767 RepID=W0V002_9BURK|nr:hypothetical protein [Janthinobacterium agaricidamnosum]CDG81206.1 hypothetical protein GJA_546 [Janthinobacterium agaricidamnosum NBRC 102515 = DSM 9628]